MYAEHGTGGNLKFQMKMFFDEIIKKVKYAKVWEIFIPKSWYTFRIVTVCKKKFGSFAKGGIEIQEF